MIERYLNKRYLTLYLFPFILGCLTVFSFQPFNYTFINFLILPLLFYLTVYIKKKSKSVYRKKPYKKNFFLFGTFFGFGFFLCGIYWITNSLTFDDSFTFLIPIGLIVIPLFLSLFFSIPILLVGPFLNLNFVSIFLFSGSLGLFDYIRSKIFTGFPWNLWAYSFSWFNELIQILDKSGLFAFNLIIISIFTLPAFCLFKIKLGKKILYSFCLILFFIFFYLYGNYSINQNQKDIISLNDKFNIKVISPNFDLKYGLTETEIETRLEKLIRYSDPKKNLKTLFIWPEGVFSGYSYGELIKLKKLFVRNFGKDHYILFGVNRLDKEQEGIYNSLIIVNNQFDIIQEYKKQKLVPFGEFLPFEKLFNKFGLKKITEGHGSFLVGKKQKNLEIDQLNILPLICYEIIFPKLIQNSGEGTNLIINISEDGWFGDSIGPHQHFAKSIYRAIERNTFLARSANKGISAIISNKGQIIKKLNPNESGNIELEVPLIKRKNKNKNDLIFFVLLFTYIFIFKFNKKNNG